MRTIEIRDTVFCDSPQPSSKCGVGIVLKSSQVFRQTDKDFLRHILGVWRREFPYPAPVIDARPISFDKLTPRLFVTIISTNPGKETGARDR